MTLDEMFNVSGTDKGSKMHDYAKYYEEVLSPLKDKPIKFLEIGVEFGLSADVWLRYLPQAIIYGVDINHAHKILDSRFFFVQGDQRDCVFWRDFLRIHGGHWDVVVDDGCHKTSGIKASFLSLWPQVKSGGIYIIEDLMCSYHQSCNESGFPTQVEFLKTLIDDLNAQTAYVNTPEVRVFPQGTDGYRGIEWVRFSEELCIIKKK
jgi:predicted O-methyltransferase YrrM